MTADTAVGVHGVASFVTQSRKQWKSQMSALIVDDSHDCNILSLFTNSKLFQRLLCLGVGSNDECKLQFGDDKRFDDQTTATGDHWLALLNRQNIGSKSTNSSDTEAMEYEDIDRYLVAVDSAAVAKDMMEGRASRNSTSQLTHRRRQRSLSYDDQGSPLYRDHGKDFTVGQKLSLKIKCKYTKRKKAKQNGPITAKDEMDGDVTKTQKTRVVKIIDPGMIQSALYV